MLMVCKLYGGAAIPKLPLCAIETSPKPFPLLALKKSKYLFQLVKPLRPYFVLWMPPPINTKLESSVELCTMFRPTLTSGPYYLKYNAKSLNTTF